MRNQDETVIIDTLPAAQAAFICLHGLGADGFDFMPIVEQLTLPANWSLRFLFPQAPLRAVTLAQGLMMRAWCDIRSLRQLDQDIEGLRQAVYNKW